MDLQSYEQLVKSESTTKKYVLGFCWKNHQRFCPRCTSRRLYSLLDARRRCARYGVSPQRFPLYLKELEFRYNHRHEDIFPRLVQYLCDLVPNLT